ncbi:MAG: hypothetical protein FWF94_02685 [Oscillospiraceae bacterium]|nr:hypothetical protein [Oscillospiraceae bacterium]
MKLSKRILAVLLAAAMLFALAACGEKDPATNNGASDTEPAANDNVDDNQPEPVEDDDFEPSTFVDFAVMSFNNREFTIPAGTDIKAGDNMNANHGAADAIRIIGFQGHGEPEGGFADGTDSTWQILISQNGEFWENIERIEAEFYLEGKGDVEAENISNVEKFYQGGALWSFAWYNDGDNMLAEFSEDNGGDGFHWGNRMKAVWDFPSFVDLHVNDKGLSREDFAMPPTPEDPEDDASDKLGGGVNKFGLQIQTDNPVDDISARIIWTDVKIYVRDLDLFKRFVDEVTEVTGVEMSEGAMNSVIEVA